MLAESLGDAQRILAAASQAGFRESGAMSLSALPNGSINPKVAVRSSGLAIDSIIGFAAPDGGCISIVNESYLRMLTQLANKRFDINRERIARFTSLLFPEPTTTSLQNDGREDPEARKIRKRREGLARQATLQQQGGDKVQEPLQQLQEVADAYK